MANESNQAANDAAEDLINESVGFYLTPPESALGFTVDAVEPEIPTAEDATYTYDSQLDKLVALLSSQLAGFFTTYYPLASDAFDEATNWLINSITNGGTGVNANIEDQAWQRDRERIIADGQRIEGQVTVGYAAKNIMLPAGSMLKKIEQARYEAAGRIGISSTSQAIDQLKREVETVRFSIDQAIRSRQMAMGAAADYIRAIASAPDAAVRVAELNTDVQAKMMSAASQWYGARLDRDKIVLSSKLAEMESGIDIYKHRRDNATQNDEVKIKALAAAAEVFARTASAALSSLNSIASTAQNSFA